MSTCTEVGPTSLVVTRSIAELRDICPQCERRRFIPRAQAPYCTPSCKRAANTSLLVTSKGSAT